MFVLYRIDFECFDVVFILHCNVLYCFLLHVDACILQCSFFSCQLAVDCVLYYIRFVYVCFLSLHCTILDCFLIYIVDFLLYFVRIIMYISLFSSILDIYTITISLSYLLILQLTDYIFFMVVATEIVRSKPAFAMQMCDHLS